MDNFNLEVDGLDDLSNLHIKMPLPNRKLISIANQNILQRHFT